MKSQDKQYDSVLNKREWLYINDTVTTYDQGTSIIETTSLSNNSKFLDYNSAYLSVPLLIILLSVPKRTMPASCEVRSDINLHS